MLNSINLSILFINTQNESFKGIDCNLSPNLFLQPCWSLLETLKINILETGLQFEAHWEF